MQLVSKTVYLRSNKREDMGNIILNYYNIEFI